MKDRIIYCVQCEAPFIFSAAQQERFIGLGFDIPKRCPVCRRHKIKEKDSQPRWRSKGKKRNLWRAGEL